MEQVALNHHDLNIEAEPYTACGEIVKGMRGVQSNILIFSINTEQSIDLFRNDRYSDNPGSWAVKLSHPGIGAILR